MLTKRIVLGVQYDGSTFQGWQTQPNGNTVQDVLEAAIFRFTKDVSQTACAGRTDTGVHAFEQVIHFDTVLNRSEHTWVRGINTFLPSNVSIHWAKELSEFNPESMENFHARFSAASRTYCYLLYNNPIRSPIWSKKAGWYYRPLCIDKMKLAAQHLLGVHDFTVFRASSCQAKSPIKHFYDIQIIQQGDLIVFKIRANAFLHHMVRNIIGSLIFVGSGRKDPSWIQYLLNSKDRSQAAPTFMPDGLYLTRIEYEPKWELPQIKEEKFPFYLF